MTLAPIRPKFRLRTTLVVPFVLQVAAAVGLVGYLSFRNGQKAVADLANQLSNQVSNRVSQQLNYYLATPRQANEINLQAIKLEMLKPQNFGATRRFFWKQMKLAENLSYMNFGNRQGTFIGVGREDDGSLYVEEMQSSDRFRYQRYALDQQGNPTKLLATEPYLFQEDEWYRSAVTAGKPVWSPIYQWEDRPEIISISSSYPVYDSSKRLVGVLGVDFILSQINNFLRNLHISPSGKIFVIERDGMIVASSSEEKPYREINRKAQRLNIAQSQEPLMREAAQQLRDRFGTFESIKTHQLLSMRLNQEQAFVSVTPWQEAQGLNWLVVIVIPKSDFMGQINVNTRNTILLCLAALATAITIGVLTARWVTRPILSISQASDQLAQGNYLAQQVAPSIFTEIDTLANSFNTMAGQLKKSFDALRQGGEQFRGLVANIPGAIYRCQYDADWTIQYISDAIETISGYPASDFIQNQMRTYVSIIHPDDQDLVEVVINHAMVIQEPYVLDYRILHQDGSIRWVYEQGRGIFDDQGNPLYLDGAIFDVSDRKKSEEVLRIAEENYRSIFENALEGIFQSSPEGKFISVNPAMARIYGYNSPQELLDTITDISTQVYVDPADQAEFKKLLRDHDQVKNFEYQVYHKDGTIIWIQEDTRAIRDSAGQLLYHEGMIQDITERKRRENELRRQLEELKIEIDHQKREKEVAMLTESSYFKEVQKEMAEVNLDEFWS